MVGFRGTVSNFHNDTTVQLSLKDSDPTDETAKIQLHQIINEIPELKDGSRFYLHPLYFSGDVQTFALAANNYSKMWESYYGRRIIDLPDGGIVSADFVIPEPTDKQEFKELAKLNYPAEDWPKLHPRTRYLSKEEIEDQHSDDYAPMVIVNHGLAGGSHEPIIRALTYGLKKNGFEVVVLNSRGCSRTKVSTPELFSGLATDDLRNFVKLVKKLYPNRQLYSVGFSFGATILSNFLGEEGENTPFVAAAVLGNPWDLSDSAYRISSRYLSRTIFLGPVTSTLTRLVKSNRKVLSQHSDFHEDLIHAKYNSTVEFDAVFTSRIYGFQTPFQYYRAASSVNRLLSIRTPLLAINSSDDPVVGVDSIPEYEAKANPYVVLTKTDLGGHLAYLQYDGESWSVNKIVEYFTKFNELVDVSKRPETDYNPKPSKYAYKVGV